MEIKDQKDPIENDQFGDAESTQEISENTENQPLEQSNEEESLVENVAMPQVPETPETPETEGEKETEEPEEPEAVVEVEVEAEGKEASKDEEQQENTNAQEEKEPEMVADSPVNQKESSEQQHEGEQKLEPESPAEALDDNEEDDVVEPINLEDEDAEVNEEADEETDDDDSDDVTDTDTDTDTQPIDYSHLSREELLVRLAHLLENKPIQKTRAEVESIKVNFYKKHKAEFEKKRKEWVEAGGEIEEFEAPEDPMEPQIKELLKQYRELKAQFNRDLEVQKVKNLEAKQAIIEQIKDLVNRNESVNQTFQEFRELQQQWREIGPVPQANLNDLWETYHHHVQGFYDYVKINKELKDLDLKRNLEEKLLLCEKAEELLLEPSVVTAFKKLQKLHNQWREVGPVPNESRTEIWERFKDVTSSINKRHQEHFESLREEQKVNLDAKAALCEKAEELAAMVIESAKDWNKLSKEMIDLQKIWKTIGFAPKKDNNKVYDRFRQACDNFFNNKREYYQEAREEQLNNLQLKTELCMQAEALKDNSEWKKTSDELINMQKRWKEIGPVPRKHSDDLWKRFRTACDQFFEKKSQHFSQVDNKYIENLKAKEELIAEIEEYKATDIVEESLKVLKDFQRRWAEIGFVPIKKKDELQKKYRDAINKHFENLKIDNSRKNILKFKTKIDTIQGNPRQENKIRMERERLFNQMKQLENDIVLWENNIGFFAKSKNAEQLIKDVENKIVKARVDLKVIEEKIRMIDNMD